MAAKAIELLSQDKDGFLLMVEGSQVDWANHANDPIYAVTDFLAFDEAVGEALDFAKQDGHTLVLAFPDHNTGGLTIGNYYQETNAVGHSYTKTTIEDVVNPLKGMKITSQGLAAKLSGITDNDEIRDTFQEWWNLEVTDEDIASMDLSNYYSIAEYINAIYTVFGWTTHGHAADDVPLWAYSSKNNTPRGHFDNTELAQIVTDNLKLELDTTQQTLYVSVSDTFTSSPWKIDSADPKNPVLVITINGKTVNMPISKDQMTITQGTKTTTYNLEGLTISAPNINDVFIPQQAVDMLE